MRTAAGALLAGLALVGAPDALASRIVVRAPVRISGASPFSPSCVQAAGVNPSVVQRGAEVEPSLAVAPGDPSFVVAGYQQDRLTTGASLGNLVAVSHDGGRTFEQRLLPGTTKCEGGTPVGPAASPSNGTDPSVTIGAGDLAYVSTQVPDGYIVSRSADGGGTWRGALATTTPLFVPGTPGSLLFFDDKDSLVANPVGGAQVSLVWDQFTGIQLIGALSSLAVQEATVTSLNGGRSWSDRQIPYSGLPPLYSQAFPTLLALPHGRLVLIFSYVRNDYALGLPAQPGQILAMRSDNGGASWSAPVVVATVPPDQSGVSDPGTGACVRTGGDCGVGGVTSLPGGVAAAAGPDGSIDVVWQQEQSMSSGRILLARSSDGGSGWSAPTTVVQTTEVFLPEVAVMPNGAIGVSYDRFRPYANGDRHVYADVWLSMSTDGGRTFPTTVTLGGPFDIRAAPQSMTENVGRFLGDYQGMVAFPDGFGVDYAASAPMAVFGASDVFFSRAVVSGGARPRHGHHKRHKRR